MTKIRCFNCGCEYESRIHDPHGLCPSCELLRLQEERNQQELEIARAREDRERKRDYEENERRKAAEEAYRREHAVENAEETTRAIIGAVQVGVIGVKAYLGIGNFLAKTVMGDSKDLKIRHGCCFLVFQWLLRGIFLNMGVVGLFMLLILNTPENCKLPLFITMMILFCLTWPVVSILLAKRKRKKLEIYKGLKLEGGNLENKNCYGLVLRELGKNGEECVRLLYDIFSKELHMLMGDIIPISVLAEHLNKSCPFILASSPTTTPINKLKEDLQVLGATVQILEPNEKNKDGVNSTENENSASKEEQKAESSKIMGCCPHCNGEFEAQKEWDGMEADCPHCGKKFTIKLS